ncbi:MAG TPA: hypothetical protein VFV34_13290 [Blastocatellia bacterium]|nr:hypothetical protein [Blastocatellia bacterium]
MTTSTNSGARTIIATFNISHAQSVVVTVWWLCANPLEGVSAALRIPSKLRYGKRRRASGVIYKTIAKPPLFVSAARVRFESHAKGGAARASLRARRHGPPQWERPTLTPGEAAQRASPSGGTAQGGNQPQRAAARRHRAPLASRYSAAAASARTNIGAYDKAPVMSETQPA